MSTNYKLHWYIFIFSFFPPPPHLFFLSGLPKTVLIHTHFVTHWSDTLQVFVAIWEPVSYMLILSRIRAGYLLQNSHFSHTYRPFSQTNLLLSCAHSWNTSWHTDLIWVVSSSINCVIFFQYSWFILATMLLFFLLPQIPLCRCLLTSIMQFPNFAFDFRQKFAILPL